MFKKLHLFEKLVEQIEAKVLEFRKGKKTNYAYQKKKNLRNGNLVLYAYQKTKNFKNNLIMEYVH